MRFADGADELLRADSGYVLLEASPGQTLAPLARQTPGGSRTKSILSSLARRPRRHRKLFSLRSAAYGWKALPGIGLDRFPGQVRPVAASRCRPIHFERKRYWIEPPAASAASSQGRDGSPSRSLDLPEKRIIYGTIIPAEKLGTGSESHPYHNNDAADAAGPSEPARKDSSPR